MKTDKELTLLLKEKYNLNRKQIVFILDYIQTKSARESYKKFYPNVTDASASVNGSRILSRIDMGDLLDLFGHGIDRVQEALDNLIKDKPADYIKHIAQFRKLDTQRVELSGEIKMPNITIVTTKKDSDE